MRGSTKTALGAGSVLAAVVALTVLWTASCAGPEPHVVEATFQPPVSPGQPYSLRAVVENRGGGNGEVGVSFSMKDRVSGRTYKAASTLTLEQHERAVAVTDLILPPGDYALQVKTVYPPD